MARGAGVARPAGGAVAPRGSRSARLAATPGLAPASASARPAGLRGQRDAVNVGQGIGRRGDIDIGSDATAARAAAAAAIAAVAAIATRPVRDHAGDQADAGDPVAAIATLPAGAAWSAVAAAPRPGEDRDRPGHLPKRDLGQLAHAAIAPAPPLPARRAVAAVRAAEQAGVRVLTRAEAEEGPLHRDCPARAAVCARSAAPTRGGMPRD